MSTDLKNLTPQISDYIFYYPDSEYAKSQSGICLYQIIGINPFRHLAVQPLNFQLWPVNYTRYWTHIENLEPGFEVISKTSDLKRFLVGYML